MIKDILKKEYIDLANNYVNDIVQLTNDPDFVTEGEEKYIGYEKIGKYYSGPSKVLDDIELKKGEVIAKYIGDGILFDLACGDGAFTVPIAKYKTKIVAGDISNEMLNILKYRAEINDITLETVKLCRVNALHLPFKDESFDFVIANSFLHLTSVPDQAIDEIYRVLKKGGKFLHFKDSPARKDVLDDVEEITEEEKANNQKYLELLYAFDKRYWSIIRGEYNIGQSQYSWKYDCNEKCTNDFVNKEEVYIEHKSKKSFNDLWEGYLFRMSGKGFSSQSLIPDDIHKKVFTQVMDEFVDKYKEDFYKNYIYTYINMNTTLMTVYIK